MFSASASQFPALLILQSDTFLIREDTVDEWATYLPVLQGAF